MSHSDNNEVAAEGNGKMQMPLTLSTIKLVLISIMVGALPFSSSLKTITLALLIGIVIVQVWRKEIVFRLTVMHVGWLLFLGAALISTVFALDVQKSVKGVTDAIHFIAAFCVAATIQDEKQSRIVLWSFFASTAIAAVLGVAYAVQHDTVTEIHQLRNPNYVGMYMMIVLCAVVSTIIFSKSDSRRLKAILIALAALLVVAALMTRFRAPFLALAAYFFIMIVSEKHMRRFMFFTSSAVFALLGFGVYLYKPMWEKLLFTPSLVSRFYMWQDAFSVFRVNPLWGIGLNNFKHVCPPGSPEAGAVYYDAHNVYLQTASQMGLLGLVSLGIVLAGFVRIFAGPAPLSPQGNVLKYSALGAVMVIFITGIFDTTLHHSHAVAFAVMLGLYAASCQHDYSARSTGAAGEGNIKPLELQG